MGDNPTSMPPTRSTSEAPATLPIFVALGAFIAGAALMLATANALLPRLGIRGGLAAAELALALPALGAAAVFRLGARRVIGTARPSRRQWVLTLLLVLPLWLAAGGLLEIQQIVLPIPDELLERFRALHAALRPKDAFDALLSVATIALAPALAEELLVRGTLLPALARITPRRVAIVLSAVAFALIHSDPRLWLFTFALGLVLGWLRLRSGTLLLPMAVHATFNTITFLVAPLVDDGTNATNPAAGLMLLLGGLVFGLPLGRALDRSMGPTSSD